MAARAVALPPQMKAPTSPSCLLARLIAVTMVYFATATLNYFAL